MQVMSGRYASIVVVLLLCGIGCTPAVTSTKASKAEVHDEGYVIGTEDVLEIAVWQNQDISRTVTVRPDGKISLPLIHDVQAAGLTPDQLKQSIAQKLKPYMESPNVTVIVQQTNSWRVFIQGEVHAPGVFPLKSRTTVSQAITMAGGLTEFAKKSKIKILRKRDDETEIIWIKYNQILSGKHPEEDIYLRPGDTVIVP